MGDQDQENLRMNRDEECEGEFFPRTSEMHPHSPLFWVANKDRYLRQLLIRDIERITRRPLCVYFASSEIPSRITQEDVSRLMEIISSHKGSAFDRLIETGGGDTDATEGIVGTLRSISPNFRAVVANRAKSNGTLICLAAEEIVMGVTSELGPIEPSVNSIPASILMSEEYKSVGFAMHTLGTYAFNQTKTVAKSLLETGMMKHHTPEEIQASVDTLCTRKKYPSHGSVIDHNEATRLGLKVTYLDCHDKLWQKIWQLWCIYMFDTKLVGLSKIFEDRKNSHAVAGPDPYDV